MTATEVRPRRRPTRRVHTVAGNRPLVYIAAPYTRPDPVANTRAVVMIADALLVAGVIPLVPHLSLLWELISPKPYQDWLDYDRHLLTRCDALLRVPGDSLGAMQESDLAHHLGIPVIRPFSNSADDCAAAVREWMNSPGKESL